MRVLVLSAYYEPEIAASLYLSTNLYEDMAEYGWNVKVIAPMPSRGIDNKLRNKYKKLKYEEKIGGKLKIHRFPMFKEGNNPISRAFRYLLINIIFIIKGLKSHTDIIFVQSTPPTQGAMASILKRFKRVPVVYNLQDIFPDSLITTGLSKKGSVLWKLGRLIENYSYNNVDRIVVISEDFKDNILLKGVPLEKIEVIYNWVDENAVKKVNREKNKLFDKYNLDRDKFYISYCGNIGLTQNMDLLIEVAKDLKNYKEIMFVLIGDGAYKNDMEKKIKEWELENIKLLPFQPYEDISHVFSLGDIGLIISKENVGQNSVPSKTWSIMSAEKPILASFDIDSELSKIINKSECGKCVQAGNKMDLIDSILNFYDNKNNLKKIGENGRDFILNNLTRNSGTKRYIQVIEKVYENLYGRD